MPVVSVLEPIVPVVPVVHRIVSRVSTCRNSSHAAVGPSRQPHTPPHPPCLSIIRPPRPLSPRPLSPRPLSPRPPPSPPVSSLKQYARLRPPPPPLHSHLLDRAGLPERTASALPDSHACINNDWHCLWSTGRPPVPSKRKRGETSEQGCPPKTHLCLVLAPPPTLVFFMSHSSSPP